MKKLLFITLLCTGLPSSLVQTKTPTIYTDKLIKKFIKNNTITCKTAVAIGATYILYKCTKAYLEERRRKQYQKIADQQCKQFFTIFAQM